MTGLELYNQFTNKASDGTLPAIYLRENLNNMGYMCQLRYGSILDLKHAVSKDVPVLVVIRENENSQGLHYVPIVGYDEEYLYMAESLDYLATEDQDHYNRKIRIDTFKKLWKTNVFMTDYLYLTVRTSH